MYAQGCGYAEIINRLNALGRKTKLGRPFGKNSIHDLLINEKYVGVYVFNYSTSKDAMGKRNNHARKNDDEVIRVPGGVPSLVSQDLFDRVQEKMRRNKRMPGSYKAKELYLLSGLIFCGECADESKQYAMAGNAHINGRNKSRYISYRCGKRDRNKSCSNTELRREYIESFVLSELEKRIFNDGNIPVLVKKLNHHLQRNVQSDAEEQKRIQSALSKIKKQIENIVDAVTNGFAQQSFLDKMAELEDQQTLLETRLQELEASKKDVVVTEDMLRIMFSMFRQAVKERNLPELKRFVESYVQKVVVYRNHVEVTFRIQLPGQSPDAEPYQIQSEASRQKIIQGSGIVA